MEPNSIGLLSSAPECLRNNDAEYQYRQNSDFYYLTGFTEGNYKDFINRGKKDFVYMKYTDDGTEESSYQFGTEEDDELKSIILRNSTELIVAGHTDGKYSNFNNYGGSDFILIKFGENQKFK